MVTSSRFLALLVSVSLLTGCALGPNYRPPETPLTARFLGQDGVERREAQSKADLQAWWAGFDDPALAQLALIVRGADTSRLDLTPQSAGLYALSLGLSHTFADDHEMLKHGMVMYDALYVWCKDGQEEVHTWNPEAYRQ